MTIGRFDLEEEATIFHLQTAQRSHEPSLEGYPGVSLEPVHLLLDV